MIKIFSVHGEGVFGSYISHAQEERECTIKEINDLLNKRLHLSFTSRQVNMITFSKCHIQVDYMSENDDSYGIAIYDKTESTGEFSQVICDLIRHTKPFRWALLDVNIPFMEWMDSDDPERKFRGRIKCAKFGF